MPGPGRFFPYCIGEMMTHIALHFPYKVMGREMFCHQCTGEGALFQSSCPNHGSTSARVVGETPPGVSAKTSVQRRQASNAAPYSVC